MQPMENYQRNHQTMLQVVSSPIAGDEPARQTPFVLVLERILMDRALAQPVTFEGARGIEAVLESVGESWRPFARIRQEGHLVGLRGDLLLAGGRRTTLAVTLGAGGQIICSAGPSAAVRDALEAIEAFDRQVHVTTRGLGCDYELMAIGYNPAVSSPLDVSLVPKTRWTLLNAHLSQTGRYARDAMRCGCGTFVQVRHGGGADAMVAYRLAAALSPLLSFLTDNVGSFRGTSARRNPRMVRASLLDEVDPERCGIVPGTFAADFSFEGYVRWMEGIQPILFAADDGTTTSTGKETLREVMDGRVFSRTEAIRLLRTVYPHARLLRGCIELRQADALRPREAAGYLAFVKGLFATELAVDSARTVLGSVSEADVEEAFGALRRRGWDAQVYGRNAAEMVDELLQVARLTLEDADERSLLDGLAELWEVRMVPRDAFLHREAKEARGW